MFKRKDPGHEIIAERKRSRADTTRLIDSGRDEGDKAWRQIFQVLLRFKIRTGHCEVPQIYRDNPKLGRWASNQRAQHRMMIQGKASPMTLDRKEALEEAGFEWKGMRKEKRKETDVHRKDPGHEIEGERVKKRK